MCICIHMHFGHFGLYVHTVISALDTLDDLRTTNKSDFENINWAVLTDVLNAVLWTVPVLFPFIQASTVILCLEHYVS